MREKMSSGLMDTMGKKIKEQSEDGLVPFSKTGAAAVAFSTLIAPRG